MQSRRVKISVSLPRDLVARMDRTARVEARSRSRVLEGWLRATARESAAREVEAATVEYYESLTATERREDEAMAAASSAAARRMRVDDPPLAGARTPRRRTRGG
jgi:metal-responsive CopG/Arc/MetJ family transcriptional regulator